MSFGGGILLYIISSHYNPHNCFKWDAKGSGGKRGAGEESDVKTATPSVRYGKHQPLFKTTQKKNIQEERVWRQRNEK